MVGETFEELFKENVVRTFHGSQLDTIKSMCINVTMNHLGFRERLNRHPELDAEFGLTPAELAKIRQAMANIEMDLPREVMELRRKAWDKAMAQLPPPMVEKLEDQLGLGACASRSNRPQARFDVGYWRYSNPGVGFRAMKAAACSSPSIFSDFGSQRMTRPNRAAIAAKWQVFITCKCE